MSRIKLLAGVVGLAVVLLVAAIGLLSKPTPAAENSPAAPTPLSVRATSPPAAQASPTPAIPAVQSEADEIVATINGRRISGAEWANAVKLDAAMSRLAGQSAPQPEDTLDRLINESLVLQAGPSARAFTPAEAETRLQTLMRGWQVAEPDLTAVLTEAQLNRDEVLARIQTLLTVEDALQQMAATGIDMNTWLPQARLQAEVGLYQAAPFREPTPAAVAAVSPPAPTPALAISDAPAPPADLPVSPYPQAVAPDFSAETLTGASITLSRLRGKPTLINFWASWCGPCRQELPALQDAYTRYQNDINFVAVNVKEAKNTIQTFAENNGLTFPIVLDLSGRISSQLYQVRGIPTTFFIDSRGVIVERHVGPLNDQSIDSYLLPLLSPAPDTVAAADTPAPPDVPTRTVNPAPDFSLPDAQGLPFNLNETLQDGPVVLVFYRGVT